MINRLHRRRLGDFAAGSGWPEQPAITASSRGVTRLADLKARPLLSLSGQPLPKTGARIIGDPGRHIDSI